MNFPGAPGRRGVSTPDVWAHAAGAPGQRPTHTGTTPRNARAYAPVDAAGAGGHTPAVSTPDA